MLVSARRNVVTSRRYEGGEEVFRLGEGNESLLGRGFSFCVCVCVVRRRSRQAEKKGVYVCVYVRDISRVGKAGIALFNLLCGSPTIQL